MRSVVPAACLGIAFVAGCAEPHLAAPPSNPPAIARLEQAIPPDLDVTLRIDLRQIRDALGAPFLDDLKRRAVREAGSSDPETERLIADAIAHADVAIVGLRPGRPPESTDNVVALSGDFSRLSVERYATEPRFGEKADLGGAYRVYARAAVERRASPARIYTRASDLLIFVSSAEIDSVERRLERGILDPALEAPAKGVFALAARSRTLAARFRDRSPALGRLLEHSNELQVHADSTAEGISVVLELRFDAADQASRTAAAARIWSQALGEQSELAAQISRAVTIDCIGSAVVARLTIDSGLIARLQAVG